MTGPEPQRRGPLSGLFGFLLFGFCAVLALGSLGAVDPSFTRSVATPNQRQATASVELDRQHRVHSDGADPTALLRHLPPAVEVASLLVALGIGLVTVRRWILQPVRGGRLLASTAAPRGPPSFC